MLENFNNEILRTTVADAVKDALSHSIGEFMYPDFPKGNVPVSVAAKVYGKNECWVRAGIIAGWLPIGRATRNGELVTDINQMNSKYGNINYQISPKKLWEDTGFVWKG